MRALLHGLAALVAVAALAPGAALAQTPLVEAFIDLSKPEDVSGAVSDLQGKLSGAKGPIRLDLRIRPKVTGGRADFQIVRTTASGGTAPVRCADALRYTAATRAFTIGFSPDYTHLMLEVLNASPQAAPFNAAFCEYAPNTFTPAGDMVFDFVIRGYFAVSVVAIPTAQDIQLRPVTPTVAP